MGRLGRIAGAASLLAAAGAAGAPDGVLAERRTGEHRAGEIMRDLREAVLQGREVRPLEAQAQLVAAWTARLPGLFPPGSDQGETFALPVVWSDRAGFERMAHEATEQAQRLAAAARAGDRAGFAVAYRATAEACGVCHRIFRQR